MLTNEEKLKELRNLLVLNPDDPIDDYLTPADMIDFIDELLALRSMRDAGDDNQLIVQLAGCLCAAEGATDNPAKQGDYGWSLAYQKTLELHQQLREAREEIERLKRENKTLKGCFQKAAFETADGYQVVINRKDIDLSAKPQHEDGDGGHYDLFPGGLYQ